MSDERPPAVPGPPGAAPVAPLPWRWGRALDATALVAVAVAAVALRVLQRSPLWLDEALSANIAALDISEIPGALRADGHPPLYYVLLHLWQDVVGDSATAARFLSAVIGLALLPLAWAAGRRLGGRRGAWAATLVVALNPFVLRYSTEARMYALVMVLVLAGWLVADDALERPTPARLAGLAGLTGALLWTHYWGIWLAATAGAGLLVRAARAHRAGRAGRRRRTLLVAGALVAGGLTFLPWVPTLLYQSAHTGTPWATPSLPTEVAAVSLVDLAGGPAGESVLLAVLLALLVVLGLCAAPGTATRLELDLLTRPEARRAALLVAGTLALASAASYAAHAAYASRYFAVVAPLVLVLAGLGASRVGGAVAFRLLLVAVLLLGAAAGTRSALTRPRTQAGEVAEAVAATAPEGAGRGPLVLACPDQLGPALSRELPEGTEVATYPRFARAERVDWVDYEEGLADVDPAAFAREALERAEGRDLWLVWSGTYRTHEGTCERVANELQVGRPIVEVAVSADQNAFESANAYRYPAP